MRPTSLLSKKSAELAQDESRNGPVRTTALKEER